MLISNIKKKRIKEKLIFLLNLQVNSCPAILVLHVILSNMHGISRTLCPLKCRRKGNVKEQSVKIMARATASTTLGAIKKGPPKISAVKPSADEQLTI